MHSEYSLLDGSCRLKDLVEKAKAFNMPAVAVTDHGTMYGTVEFFKMAKKAGVKPIVGCEVYVAPRTRFDRTPKVDDDLFHLVLLTKDLEGYRSLLKIVTQANLEGFYYKPRVDHELLSQNSKGLIAMSACLQGEIPDHLLGGRQEVAEKKLQEYLEIFGKDNFYLELMDHGLEKQKLVNPMLIELSRKTGVPLVATNDAHYMNKEDSLAHDVQLCINTGKTFSESKRLSFDSEEFYFKSGSEMMTVFRDVPEAISNTLEVASRCNLELDFSTYHLPHFPVPEGKSLDGFLEELCVEGLGKRYAQVTPELEKRMRYELSVIKEMGFAGYFLIIWDFLRFAKSVHIPVGPGRGSAAGSIVAYLLEITDIDPIKFNLLFERFLNPGRKSMPDVDTDFCVDRREEVIRYVNEKYGTEHVSQIITFGRMKAKAAIRDVGRVLGMPLPFVDKIAKLIPFGMTIEEAVKTPELAQQYKAEQNVKQLIDTAKVVEGLARNASIHAAGVIISKDPLHMHVPLQKMNGDEVVAQYEMNSVSDIGLLKMDFLGLRNLTVINHCLKTIERDRGIKIDLFNLPLDDEPTYKLLQEARTGGVFQFESSGMQRYLRMLRPDRFEDIVALAALYRPGPLKGGLVDDFIKRRHGKKEVEYLHLSLEPILKETYGVIVYQEQVMQIANILAGYSMAQADDLRKAMGKKKAEVMAQQKKSFLDGCKKNEIEAKAAGKIWEFMEYFAGYGFNKSHTVAYATVAYQTAYLKANYPLEYMASLLTSVMDKIDKVSGFINECKNMGVEVLPPDINESGVEFTVSRNAIRFGLAAIKNVGRNAIESIIETRARVGRFESIEHFCSEVDMKLVNKKVLESLIKSGAMNCLGETRATLMVNIDYVLDCGSRIQKEKQCGQISLFELSAGDSQPVVMELPHKAPEYENKTLLSFEKEMLGLYITDHPMNSVAELLKGRVGHRIADLGEMNNGVKVTCAAMVRLIKRYTTKRNQSMAFLEIEDLSGAAEVVVLPPVFEKTRDYLKDDALVIIEGKVEVKEGDEAGEDEEMPASVAKLIADEIYPIEAIEAVESLKKREKSPYYGCHIKIDCSKAQCLENLKEIVLRSKGNVPLFLHLESPGGRTIIELPEDYWIAHSRDFASDVEQLMGTGSLWNQ